VEVEDGGHRLRFDRIRDAQVDREDFVEIFVLGAFFFIWGRRWVLKRLGRVQLASSKKCLLSGPDTSSSFCGLFR